MPGAQLKDKIRGLEARKAELTELLADAVEPPPLLHPNMLEIYRQRIWTLYKSLQSEDGEAGAAEVFRTLVDQVTLVPPKTSWRLCFAATLQRCRGPPANRKTPTSFWRLGFWVPCFCKDRWLRGLDLNQCLQSGYETANYLAGMSSEVRI